MKLDSIFIPSVSPLEQGVGCKSVDFAPNGQIAYGSQRNIYITNSYGNPFVLLLPVA